MLHHRVRSRFDIVVRRLDIHFLVVDHMAVNRLVHLSANDMLAILRLFQILKLHLDKPEAPSSLRLPVSHDDRISDDAEFLEVLN